MKLKNLAAMSLLLVFVASCSTPRGNFCLSANPLYLKEKTIDFLIENDMRLARGIVAHNAYGENACDWEFDDGS